MRKKLGKDTKEFVMMQSWWTLVQEFYEFDDIEHPDDYLDKAVQVFGKWTKEFDKPLQQFAEGLAAAFLKKLDNDLKEYRNAKTQKS